MWTSPGGVGVTTTTPETPGAAPPAPTPTGGPPVHPPFAPYGPFAPGAQPPGPPLPPVAYGPPPQPPRPRPPRSRLGGLTVSVILLVLGGLGVVELIGYDVPTAGYFAAALATVGAGLLVGAWIGRARGLIALGIILALALASITAVEPMRRWHGGVTTWAP